MAALVAPARAAALMDLPHRETEGMAHLDRATRVFLDTRPRLFGIAYRILRNPVEAEDVVQNAWLRWQTTDRSAVVNPEAFLDEIRAHSYETAEDGDDFEDDA